MTTLEDFRVLGCIAAMNGSARVPAQDSRAMALLTDSVVTTSTALKLEAWLKGYDSVMAEYAEIDRLERIAQAAEEWQIPGLN